MSLYPSHGLQGLCRNEASHILTCLVENATLGDSGPIRECSYTRDNPLKTPITGAPTVLIDSSMPI